MNDEWLPPHEVFYGSRPTLPLLPFQPAYYPTSRQRKVKPRACMFYFLNFGYNHGRDGYKLLGNKAGKVVYSRDTPWYHPEVSWITQGRNTPMETPRDIYVPYQKMYLSTKHLHQLQLPRPQRRHKHQSHHQCPRLRHQPRRQRQHHRLHHRHKHRQRQPF